MRLYAVGVIGLLAGVCGALWFPLPPAGSTGAQLRIPVQRPLSEVPASKVASGDQPLSANQSGRTSPFPLPSSSLFGRDFLLTIEASVLYGLDPAAVVAINEKIARTGRRAYEQRIQQARVLKEEGDEVMVAAPRNPQVADTLEDELKSTMVSHGMPPEVFAAAEYREWFHRLSGGLRVDDATYIVRSSAEIPGSPGESILISVRARPERQPATSVRYFTKLSELQGFEQTLLEKTLPTQYRARRGL